MSNADLPIRATWSAGLLPTPAAAGASAARLAAGGQDDRALVEAAKDFESVLLHKLMEAMGETIPDGGLLTSNASKQYQGMFWSFLARDVADKGGLGLWQDVYKQFADLAARGRAEALAQKEPLP